MTIASTGGTVTLGLYDTQSQLKEKADITYVDNKVDPLQAGHKGYATLAQAQAAQSGLAANTVVEVLSDATEANNGYYIWNGTTLTKTAFSPLVQANNYTDSLYNSLVTETEQFANQAEAAATSANIAGKVYATPSEGVAPVTGVPSGQYFNVRSSSNDNYIDEYLNNAGVAQATGKSYPSSNSVVTKDKILDSITGQATASKVFALNGDNLQEVNDKVLLKTYSLSDSGGLGNGNNDTTALNTAISLVDSLNFDTKNSLLDQTLITKTVEVIGKGGSSNTSQQNKHIFYLGAQKDSEQEIAGILIENQKVSNLTFTYMPQATQDDFAAITLAQTRNATVKNSSFYDVENAVSVQSTPSKYGKVGEGSKDNLIDGIYVYKNRRYVLQNIQGSYTKFVNSTAHNNGDNTTVPSGEVNNGGWNGGIRLAGLGKGNIVANNVIRDRYTAIDFQRGQEYNVVASNYFENTFSNTFNASTTNLAAGGYHNIDGAMIVNAGANGLRLSYLGLINVRASVHGATVYGLEYQPSIANDELFIVTFEGGAGTVPAVGSTLTQGTVTSVVHQVRNEALTVLADGSPMPTKGTILIKSLSGRLSPKVNFTELTATVKNIKVGEGHSLGDILVSQSLNSGARIATNGNNLRLNINASDEHPAIISGNFNNITLVISERVTGKYVQITGSNNTINIIDNSKVTTDAAVSVTGSNNIVTVNTKGRVLVGGSNNTIVCETSRLALTGNNNVALGRTDALVNTGTGNNLQGLSKCTAKGVVSLTTNSSGQVTITHGMLVAATSLNLTLIESTTLVHVTIANIAPNATTSTVQVWTAAGVKAGNGINVTLSYSAQV